MMKTRLALGAAAFALMLTCPAAAQEVITTPEGAIMESGASLAYAPGELSDAQLNGNARHLFRQDSANVFRRFPRELTEEMVNFYVGALGLRSLNPIQLTASQQMILTGVGTGQIKLSAGQEGNRLYNLSGGYAGGTGIRFLVLSYPDADVVAARFTEAGFTAPHFTAREDGTAQALVQDPAGMDIVIVVNPEAADHSDDGVGVGIQVSNLDASRAFYRDFVGLDELDPVESTLLGTTLYPYAHAETTILLYKMGDNLPADTGSSGIQYVVADAPYVAAMADHRHVTVETPLNRLRGFDLTTIWLNDPDGVTNYFAQVGPNSRTARGEN
ncbi:VOC family protein [Alteraurantiacibacter palmitatis]|uniref:VOC family protein n=1 Tax=Alteraurantiacibacter palmitatis TaxID=2054628 RepID=A0ABV7E3X1_9SPHN